MTWAWPSWWWTRIGEAGIILVISYGYGLSQWEKALLCKTLTLIGRAHAQNDPGGSSCQLWTGGFTVVGSHLITRHKIICCYRCGVFAQLNLIPYLNRSAVLVFIDSDCMHHGVTRAHWSSSNAWDRRPAGCAIEPHSIRALVSGAYLAHLFTVWTSISENLTGHFMPP